MNTNTQVKQTKNVQPYNPKVDKLENSYQRCLPLGYGVQCTQVLTTTDGRVYHCPNSYWGSSVDPKYCTLVSKGSSENKSS